MPDPDSTPSQPRPGTSASAPSVGHYAVELPYAEELQALLEGRYMVESFLGQGGMGAVYRGLQMPLKRPVAIKILQKKQAGAEDDEFAFEERFKREAYAMAALAHPHIVQVYDCGDAGDNFLFISMELVEGGDLSDAIKAGTVTPEVALKLIPQICDGLQAAHERGIVHRDIKPANIFLTADGRAKVADFGLAKKFDAKSTFVTKTGLGMGTPDYAAPEQYEGVSDIDHRADIYAFGVMMYQMLTGRLPRGVYKMPSQLVPIDPRLDDVVGRAMANEREDRWQSTAEIKAAIHNIMTQPQKAATAAVRTSAVPVAAKTAMTQRPKAQPGTRTSAVPAAARPAAVAAPAPPPKKSGMGMLLGAVGAMAVLGGGAFFMLKKPEPAPSIQTGDPSAAPAVSGAASLTPDAAPPRFRPILPGEKWVDGLAEWLAVSSNVSGGLLTKTPEGFAFTRRGDVHVGGKLQNVAVRATVRKINWYAEVRAISSNKPPDPQRTFTFTVMVRGPGERAFRSMIYNQTGSELIYKKQWMPPDYEKDGRYEMELRIENGTATVFLNGEQQASAPASDKGTGNVILAGGEGMIIERYEYLDLGSSSAPIAGNPVVVKSGQAEVVEMGSSQVPVTSLPFADSGALKFGGHRYQIVSAPVSWKQAQTRCEGMGGHLATITSKEEHEFIMSRLAGSLNDGHYWIGLSRGVDSDQWKWVTGETAAFMGWATAQPDASLKYDCAAGYWFRDGNVMGWDDVPGADTLKAGFIVEWDDAGSAPATSPPASGTVNLLALVDADAVKIEGDWKMVNGELTGNGSFARLAFNYQPPEEYDFRISFTRKNGVNAVGQHLARGGRDIMWIMGGFSNSAWGFEQVGSAKANANATTVKSGLENGRRYDSVVKVRRDRATVEVDGKQVAALISDGSDWVANPKWAFPDAGKLGLGCQQETVFHRIEVIPFAGAPATPVTAETSADPVTQRLAQFESSFQSRFETDAEKSFLAAVAALNQSYVANGIARARATALAAGNSSEVSALDAEKSAIENGAGIPPQDDAATPASLKTLRGTYRTALAKYTADRDAQAQPLYGIYLSALDGYISELTRANKVSDALRVKQVRDEVGAKASGKTAATVKIGRPIFDGSTLKGWRLQGAQGAFVVEDGCIKATGAGATLMFSGLPGVSPIMKDFDLTLKVKTEGAANSGIFVHCPRNGDGVSYGNALELQIANENRDPQKTGSVWGVKSVDKIIVHDGEWFDYRIEVRGKTVTTYINGKEIIQWTQPDDWKPQKAGARLSEGTIGLQSNGGVAWFKELSLATP